MRETDEALETLLADSGLHDADKAALREYQQYRKFRSECQQKGIKPIPTLANWLKLRKAPAPSALDTARAALERIANESDLRMSAYLSSDDMLRDYIGKVVRMKRIAADALAGLEGGEQP